MADVLFSTNNSVASKSVHVIDDANGPLVGIGTLTPTHNLEVVGTTQILNTGGNTLSLSVSSSNVTTFTASSGTGSNRGGSYAFTAGNGDSAGTGRGGNFNFTTGDPSSGQTQNAGDFIVNLGTGPNPNVAGSAGRQGRFIINAQQLGIGLSTNPIVMDAYGVGIGNNTAGIYGTPFQVNWTATDPTADVGGVAVGYLTLDMTGNNSKTINSGTAYLVSDATSFNWTGTLQPWNVEFVLKKTGGTVSNLIGTSSELLPASTSACTVTVGAGHYSIWDDKGANTLTTGHGVQSIASISGAGASAGTIGTWNSYQARYQITSTPGAGVITTFRGFYTQAPNLSGTGSATTAYGVYSDALFNTVSASSTTGGFTAGGALLTVGSQGGNTSGTNTNYGLYLTGNGGTAGAGGTVNNWQLFSDSRAPIQIGSIRTTDPAATYNAVSITTTAALTADNAQGVNGFTHLLQTTNTAFNYTGTLQSGIFNLNVAGTGTATSLVGLVGNVQINTAVVNGTITSATGAQAKVNHFGTGTITTQIGLDGQALLRATGGAADGNITTAVAVRGTIQNLGTAATPGVMTNAYTFHANTPSFSSTGTVTSLYGLYVQNMGNAKVTNAYGVVIEAPTAAVTINRALWVKGGEVRIDVGTANGSVATVLGSVGPTGSHTTVQEWLAITTAGGVRYIPCF